MTIQSLDVQRVAQLPAQVVANTMYFVKSNGQNTGRIFLTNNSGVITAEAMGRDGPQGDPGPASVVTGNGSNGGFNVGGALTQQGQQVFHTGNDGAGSGLDADLLDGLQGGSYVKKNNDSGIGNLSFNQGSHLNFPHANQADANDGKIGSDLFAEGLNIIGTQTVPGGGRKTRLWGDLTFDDGQLNITNQPACVVSRGTGWETWAPNTQVGIEGFSLNKGGFFLGGYINSDQRALHLPHPGLYLFIMELYGQAGTSSRMHAVKNGNTNDIICFAHAHLSSDGGSRKFTGIGVREMAGGDYVSLSSGGFSTTAYHAKDHSQLTILKIG